MKAAIVAVPVGLTILATHLFADVPGKVVTAVRTDHALVTEGLLTDPAWQTAPAVLDFTEFDPVEGARPSELTSVRLLYDDHALYVGVICYDAHPDLIVQQLTRRDRTTEADRFTVIIDSYHDRQTAFLFSANVSGVQTDGVLSQDGTVYDVTWDAVWSVTTRIFLDGWSAVFEIPFNALRFTRPENGTYEWGINFRRYISRKRETDEWVMVPREAVPPGTVTSVSKMGLMRGLAGIDPPLHLSLIPYVSGKSTFETRTADRPWSATYTGAAGLDLKYGLTRNFTLDATVNPDFGQVEVDQAVLNLTVFETLFPEKRPFFTEGSQMFAFGSSLDNTPLALFFSRRIGKQPAGSSLVVGPPGGTVEENPQVTTILGAAKLTGRSESGTSLGILSAVTDEERASVRDSLGNLTSYRTEPRAMYTVVRLKQDLQGGSWLGGMITSAVRQDSQASASGGIDWNIRFGSDAFTADGYVAGARSSVRSEGRDGVAGRLLLGRVKADPWLYLASYDFYSRQFNINDVGFFARPHDHGGYVQLLYQQEAPGGILRRYSASVVPETRWNWDGALTQANIGGWASAELTNFWSGQLTYDLLLPAYDDADRGIVGLYRRPLSHSLRLSISSDVRRNLTGTLSTAYTVDAKDKRGFSSSLGLTIRPVSWVELNPNVSYQTTRHEAAWLFPDGNIIDAAVGPLPFSVFGGRDLNELDMSLRGIVTFTRTLSLQFFSQVLLARGQYSDYMRLADPSTLVAYDYAAQPSFHSHDFNEITFNANVLLRWEFLAGSALYLVWTQGRTGDSGVYPTSFDRRFADTFALPHEDVLLVKLSYWLPM